MGIYFLFVTFVFGLIVGSFLNVVVYFIESKSKQNQKDKKQKRESLLGRSFCPSCDHKLGFWDLIPVFSWIFLGARCRHCKKPISIQYPLVELATGLVFTMTYWFVVRGSWFVDFSSVLPGYGATGLLITVNSSLLIVFVYDLKHKIIPDKVIYPAIVIAVSYWLLAIGLNQLLAFNFSLLTPIASAIGAGGFFYLLAAISDGRWMGGGDIKLAFLMGLLLGWPNILVGLFLGFFLGAVVGLVMIVLGKKKIGSEIPFGPFLITGTWVALFWGDMLVKLYLRILL